MTDNDAASRMNRRTMLLRALTFGSISPVIAGLIAGCNPMADHEDRNEEPAQ